MAVAGGWDQGSWAGSEGTGLHHSLERNWGRLFDQLPEDARTALFVVVADQDVGGRHTVQALKSAGPLAGIAWSGGAARPGRVVG